MLTREQLRRDPAARVPGELERLVWRAIRRDAARLARAFDGGGGGGARRRRGRTRAAAAAAGQWGSSVVGGGGATLPPGFADLVQHTFKLVLAGQARLGAVDQAEQRVQNIEQIEPSPRDQRRRQRDLAASAVVQSCRFQVPTSRTKAGRANRAEARRICGRGRDDQRASHAGRHAAAGG